MTTILIFMNEKNEVIRIKDLPFYPCIIFNSKGDLRVYEDYSDPSKDVLSLKGVKKIHVSAPGCGSIIDARGILPGSDVLYSITSRFLWIREDLPIIPGTGPLYYFRADDNLPAGTKLKIVVNDPQGRTGGI
jgi:hypothetical protein